MKNTAVTLHNLPESQSKNRLFCALRRLYNAYRLAIKIQGQIYHLHDPELVPVGLMLKLKNKIVIYDAHEDAPVEAISLNHNRKLKGFVLSTIWWVFLYLAKKRFDGFLAATPDIAKAFPPDRTIIVKNYPRLECFKNAQKHPTQVKKNNTLIYVGSISEIRGLVQMLDSLALLPDHLNVKLKIIGTFTPQGLLSIAMRHVAWSKVEYNAYQPWEKVISALSEASIGLVLLHPTPEYLVSLPVKLFEYMAAGIPVIASNFRSWQKIIESSQCGLMVDPLDPTAIARAIEKLIMNPELCRLMGNAGRNTAFTSYSWSTEATKLLSLYARFGTSLPYRNPIGED